MVQTALKTKAHNSDFADLVEDLREAVWLLECLRACMRDADAQADDLARAITRIDRELVLLAAKLGHASND